MVDLRTLVSVYPSQVLLPSLGLTARVVDRPLLSPTLRVSSDRSTVDPSPRSVGSKFSFSVFSTVPFPYRFCFILESHRYGPSVDSDQFRLPFCKSLSLVSPTTQSPWPRVFRLIPKTRTVNVSVVWPRDEVDLDDLKFYLLTRIT